MEPVNPEAAALGRRLREARERMQLSQTQAAAELAARGIKAGGKGTISAWEVGRSQPSPLVMRALCRLYNCSADSLLWDSQGDTPGSAEQLPAALMRRVVALNPEQRAALVRNIEAMLDLVAPAAAAAATPADGKPRFAA